MLNFNVLKSNGDLVPFDKKKLINAFLRSGVHENQVNKIISEVLSLAYEGISTKKIYQIAYRSLKKNSQNVAGRYRLKKALFELGPSGYSFEKLVGRLFIDKGYRVKVSEIIPGLCVNHEVDVVAQKENEVVMVECKFHQQPGRKSDVKVALYIKSRFDDIKQRLKKDGKLHNIKFKGYIVTNTRFTDDAIQYGKCAGLKLLSWNYPNENTLQKWIENSGYHPVTALGSASKSIKAKLLENDIVLCREIIGQEEKLLALNIPLTNIKKIIKEAKEIVE